MLFLLFFVFFFLHLTRQNEGRDNDLDAFLKRCDCDDDPLELVGIADDCVFMKKESHMDSEKEEARTRERGAWRETPLCLIL